MNASYEKNGRFDSNSRIFEGYCTECAPRESALSNTLSSLREKAASLPLLRTLRALGTALSLVGFVGVIGAMEKGSLGLLSGLAIGALLIGVEYLCLRGRRA